MSQIQYRINIPVELRELYEAYCKENFYSLHSREAAEVLIRQALIQWNKERQ